jgi:hypothetical protein
VLVQTKDCIADIKQGLEKLGTRHEVQVYSDKSVDFDSPGIKLVTHASSKGLEFDTVFLPELHRVRFDPSHPDDIRRMMFVLTARARERLILAYRGNSLPLLSIFAPDWRDLVDELDAVPGRQAPTTRTTTTAAKIPVETRPEPTRTSLPASSTSRSIPPTVAKKFFDKGPLIQQSSGQCDNLSDDLARLIDPDLDPPNRPSEARIWIRFHPEIHLFVDDAVNTYAQNPGKIIGIYTAQSSLFKRLTNRLRDKVPTLFFHENPRSSLSRPALKPGIHLMLGGMPNRHAFDVLLVPKTEILVADTPHHRHQFAALIQAGCEQVILSYQDRPAVLIPRIDSARLRKMQERT